MCKFIFSIASFILVINFIGFVLKRGLFFPIIFRKSNFLYHNGKLGYYRDIRDEPLPFIQYEDDWGNPYYLDPLKNETVYELPPDATVKHHTEKEAEDYDLLYGEGAYAEVLADRAFKMQCNADRGYVGEDGEWVNLGGYYDENFEFVITF